MWLNFFIVVLYIYIEMFITAGNRILSIFQNFVITICLPNHMFMLTVHKYNLKMIRYRKWNLLRSKIRAAWLGFEPTTPIFRQYSPLFLIKLSGLLAVNLNSSDSAWLHHTISLMYVGARHLEFGITSHIVT